MTLATHRGGAYFDAVQPILTPRNEPAVTELSEYYDAMIARFGEAAVVEPRNVFFADGSAPTANNCHDNVDRIVREQPGSEAVRGFFIQQIAMTGTFILHHHAVVRAPDGELYDPTPILAQTRPAFLPHQGSEAEFDQLRKFGQVYWPPNDFVALLGAMIGQSGMVGPQF